MGGLPRDQLSFILYSPRKSLLAFWFGLSQFRCVFIYDVIMSHPQVLSTPERTQWAAPCLLPQHLHPDHDPDPPCHTPWRSQLCCSNSYLDFHNMHNKYKRITSPILSVYFNFMKSNQGEKQHDNQAIKFSADVIMVNTTFLGLSLRWWLCCFLWGTGCKMTSGAGPTRAKQRCPCSFSFRVTRGRLIGLGHSDTDSITPSMTCTVCAQICARVSQA